MRGRWRFRPRKVCVPIGFRAKTAGVPLVQVFTSARAPEAAAQQALLAELSRLAAAHFHKPERWVMTCLVPGLAMTFGGDSAPAAFIAVKNIGTMTPDDTAA